MKLNFLGQWVIAYLLLQSACMHEEISSFSTFEEYPVYEGKDLGLQYTSSSSTFKVWSPIASALKLRLYKKALGGEPLQSLSLQKGEDGIWELSISEDLEGLYYTFQAKIDGNWLLEVPDPYAFAVGTNGKRAMVVDLRKTNPPAWEGDQRPPLNNFNDIILYELHVRDLSMHPNSGIQNKGKFLGLTERSTTNFDGKSTGLDHIKDLGVTHVHLLPSYDYLSVDESKPEVNEFNWGYDPQNYNVPEGSYATDPEDGAVRIREFKKMVKTLHDNGLRVIMDVVYNHTGATEGSNFNQLVPGYYYRQNGEGGFSDASACGNETASDRAMMRKFIVESVKYWVEEYHIDGFRFDLMGIHDIETMNLISETIHAIDPTIFIYGEGWTAGDSPLPEGKQALKRNTHLLKGIAAFSDDIRDGLKGSVFEHQDTGFVSGKSNMDESIEFGIVASTQHPQIDYSKVNYSQAPWAKEPSQTITYVSCHDNHTLWDKLMLSRPQANEEERIAMHILASTVVLTSQGVPFLHAGVEMLRTKQGVENSFESPDTINRIDWSRKTQYEKVYQYFKDLIQLRKNHPAFRMTATTQIQQHLKFLDLEMPQLVGYTISGNANGDEWKEILVVFNGHTDQRTIEIPKKNWVVVARGSSIKENGLGTIDNNQLVIPAISAMILYSNE